MRVALLGNCQVNSLAECCHALTPQIEIVARDHLGVSRSIPDAVGAAAEARAETLVVIDESIDSVRQELARIGFAPTVITIPSIHFPAFHPDSTYLTKDRAILPTAWGTHWSPRLALWAHRQGMDLGQAMRLYSREGFAAAGYLDSWEPALLALRAGFETNGFDFDRWYWFTKRTGVFMHGLNHPRPAAVAALAAQLVQDRLGLPAHTPASVVGALSDPLGMSVVWAVHEPIAWRLSVDAFEMVKLGQRYIPWEEFVHDCYEGWGREGMARFSVGYSLPFTAEQERELRSVVGVG